MRSKSEPSNPSQPPLVRGGVIRPDQPKYPYIPYQQKLVSRARELRRTSTEAEKFFWERIIKSEKFKDFKFTRQKPIDAFILDFYCARLKLEVEVDGEVHDNQNERDAERDAILSKKLGITCLRYKNSDVLNRSDWVIQDQTENIRVLGQKSP